MQRLPSVVLVIVVTPKPRDRREVAHATYEFGLLPHATFDLFLRCHVSVEVNFCASKGENISNSEQIIHKQITVS